MTWRFACKCWEMRHPPRWHLALSVCLCPSTPTSNPSTQPLQQERSVADPAPSAPACARPIINPAPPGPWPLLPARRIGRTKGEQPKAGSACTVRALACCTAWAMPEWGTRLTRASGTTPQDGQPHDGFQLPAFAMLHLLRQLGGTATYGARAGSSVISQVEARLSGATGVQVVHLSHGNTSERRWCGCQE